jgi:putative membrane protein
MKKSDVGKAYSSAVSLTGKLFYAPKPSALIIPILLSAVIGAVLILASVIEAFRFISAFLVLAIPTFLTALLTKPVIEKLKGEMYWRRSFLLAFVSLLLIIGFMLLGLVLQAFYFRLEGIWPDITVQILLFGYASTIYIRHTVLVAIANNEHRRSIFASLIQPLSGFLFLGLFFPLTLLDILKGFSFLIVFFLASFFFVEIAKKPFNRGFGIDGVELFRYFIDHFTEPETGGKKQLEKFFNSIATPIEVNVSTITFSTESGIKALVVVPTIHPGPFGTICSSDLPAKLGDGLSNITKNVIVPHAATTHDYNAATTEECKKIVGTVKSLLNKNNYSSRCSKLFRSDIGKATATAQVFDNSVFVTSSLAPNPGDDIDYPVGLSIIENAKSVGIKNCIFVDAHNCGVPRGSIIRFGSKESKDIVNSSIKSIKSAKNSAKNELKVGYHQEILTNHWEDGSGSRGIQTIVIDNKNQKSAYLVFDGNNMVMGLRERIRKRVKEFVDEAEVLTTDNHSVNVTFGGYNPVGLKIDEGKIIRASVESVKEAINNMEKAKVAFNSGTIKDFKVFGEDTAARLTTSINSTAAILKMTGLLTMSSGIILSLLISFVL